MANTKNINHIDSITHDVFKDQQFDHRDSSGRCIETRWQHTLI